MDGILIIDKPDGITSHDVVARCRRILRTKRVGHTGTLDPFATGVVVILVNQATRLAQFLDKDLKEYEALVRFGFETTTGDLTGKPRESQVSDFSKFQISDEEIENALRGFRGEIEQTPPMFSAKKIDGKKLYELARKGVEIERRPQKVTIYELEVVNKQKIPNSEQITEYQKPKTQDLTVRVVCSSGTYIRTLAEDIGRKLGVGAHLAALRRTRAGKFDLTRSVTLERLEEIAAANELEKILISLNEALSHLPEVKLNEVEARKTRSGMKLKFESSANAAAAAIVADNQAFRLTDETGNLAAVGFYKAAEKIIQPRVVLV
jgi:tRNA pseudouridine55 synthase